MSFKTTIRQRIFDIFRWTYGFKLIYIRTREELPIILNKRGLTGKGVEVGVWKGDFSNYLLGKWKGETLYSIDPWKNFSAGEYIDEMNISQADFDDIFEGVKQLLARYKDRSVIIRDVSVKAAGSFKDKSLDFVYLDGRHHYLGVKEDIEYWFPKVKPGGIICGHDYLNAVIGATQFGVKQAIDEYAQANKLKILVTHLDRYPSWFMVIPG